MLGDNSLRMHWKMSNWKKQSEPGDHVESQFNMSRRWKKGSAHRQRPRARKHWRRARHSQRASLLQGSCRQPREHFRAQNLEERISLVAPSRVTIPWRNEPGTLRANHSRSILDRLELESWRPALGLMLDFTKSIHVQLVQYRNV